MLRTYGVVITFLGLLLSGISCTKDSVAAIEPDLNGNWQWGAPSVGFYLKAFDVSDHRYIFVECDNPDSILPGIDSAFAAFADTSRQTYPDSLFQKWPAITIETGLWSAAEKTVHLTPETAFKNHTEIVDTLAYSIPISLSGDTLTIDGLRYTK
jgi:hypothetical protein